jgi:hypothetical protein
VHLLVELQTHKICLTQLLMLAAHTFKKSASCSTINTNEQIDKVI